MAGFNPIEIYTHLEIMALLGVSERTFFGWLAGVIRDSQGRNLGNLQVPLKHLRAGKVILVRATWLLDFLEANASALPADEGLVQA